MNAWPPLLTHAAALLLWRRFVACETRENARLIEADGAKDSLHQQFHAARTGIRVAVAAGLLLAVVAVSWWAGLPARAIGASTAGLLALLAGWFFHAFNPALSLLSGKAADYVSFEPGAAWFPDRLLARYALRHQPNRARAYASQLLRLLLTGTLVVGLAGEVAGLAWVLLR
ncbi:hypothetical protein ACVWYF_004131 [Hymenobacter sp. UYAg731]